MPNCAFSTSYSAACNSLSISTSESSPAYPLSVIVVASVTTNGTSKYDANVAAIVLLV